MTDSYFLLVRDDPLWLVTEVPYGEGPARVVLRLHDRAGAEFEVMRRNEEVRAR